MQSVINEINLIIDSPTSYLIEYYKNLQSKIDFMFETEIQSIEYKELKEEKTNEWINIIDLIEKCSNKCIKNKLPDEVIIETKELLDRINKIESDDDSNYNSSDDSSDIYSSDNSSDDSYNYSNNYYSDQSNDEIEDSNDELVRMKYKLQSHLFANDLCVAIYFVQRNKAYLIEGGLNSKGVEQ